MGKYHWIYILKCKDGHYYVGETSSLYRRFWEHQDGECKYTSIHIPEKIEAIYKADVLDTFINYNEQIFDIMSGKLGEEKFYNGFDNPIYLLNHWDEKCEGNLYHKDCKDIICYIENQITECLKIHNKNNHSTIGGGKYVVSDKEYPLPLNVYMEQLPLCDCGLPCDIKKHKEGHLFFRCPKNNFWKDFKDEFDIEDFPCKFYKEYTLDKYLKDNYRINFSYKYNKKYQKIK